MFTKNLSILLLCAGMTANCMWGRISSTVACTAAWIGSLKVAEVAGENKRSTGSIFGKTQIQLDMEEAYKTGETLHQADLARREARAQAQAEAKAQAEAQAQAEARAQAEAETEYNARIAQKTNDFNTSVYYEEFVPFRGLTRTEKVTYWTQGPKKSMAAGLEQVKDLARQAKNAAVTRYGQKFSLAAGKALTKDAINSVVEYGKTHTAQEVFHDATTSVGQALDKYRKPIIISATAGLAVFALTRAYA